MADHLQLYSGEFWRVNREPRPPPGLLVGSAIAKTIHRQGASLKIAIFGAGGHGKVVADAAMTIAGMSIAGFLDDDQSLAGSRRLGLPVLGAISRWKELDVDALVPGIGENGARKTVLLREQARNATIATVVHSAAIVSRWAVLGPGATVLAGAIVNADAVVGENAIINTGAIVEHDCAIGPHVHVAPGSYLAGAVRVGEGSLLGIGCRILPGVRIGSWCVVGAGAVVVGDVEDHTTVGGVPARILT
jgi:sugar O-acyltransferase (sialic acid O-acetyltransferase NeuD family)